MDSEKLDRILTDAFNERSLAGLAAGIVEDGQLAYARGFGVADAALSLAATPETTFRIGSISKTMTAIALMQLYEQGRFRLEDRVDDYLKSYRIEQPAGAKPITFLHLLTHTSGIGELRRLTDLLRPTIGLAAKPGRAPTLREYYRPALRVGVAPDVKWSYANHGFATLGQLVEDISGEPFNSYMRDHVFAPLGMDRTDCQLSDRVRGTLAQGYKLTRRGMRPIRYTEIIIGPAGSVFSSVEQMAKYMTALLARGANDHGRVLGGTTLAMMAAPHYELDPRMGSQGLAFLLGRLNGVRILGHDGGLPGFQSAMWLAPDQGIGAVVFTNTSRLPITGIAHALLRESLGERPLSRPGLLVQPTLWKELCGTYKPARGFNSNFRLWQLGGALRIFVRRGKLTLGGRHPFGPVRRGLRLDPADPSDPLLFRAELLGVEIQVLFQRNQRGRVDTMKISASSAGFLTLHKRVR